MIPVPESSHYRVRWGRRASLIMIAGSLIVGGFAYSKGMCAITAFNAFLLGVNVMLAWINWFVFEI